MKTSNGKLNYLLQKVGDMSLKRRVKGVVMMLDVKKEDRILDLGCGDGFFIYILNRLYKNEIVGLDKSQWNLKRAKERIGKVKRYKLVQDDITKSKLNSESFNKIFLTEVLEHIHRDTKALKEIYRVTKKDGEVILTVPNWRYPLLWDPINWVLQRLFNTHIEKDFWSGIWLDHVRLYKKEELVKKVQDVGFEVVEVKEITQWCLPFNHYIYNLIARFLYSDKLPSGLNESLDKFNSKQPLYVKVPLFFLNTFDKLNDLLPIGPGLFILVKAKK